MKNGIYLLLFACLILVFSGCNHKKTSLDLIVSNAANFSRKELVTIEKSQLENFLKGKKLDNIFACEKGDSTYLVVQWVDLDMDSVPDQLLFEAQVAGKEAKAFELVYLEDGSTVQPARENVAYSRFVPERTDDYAWENDKVAFRTYGPEAQRMVEEGIRGGTLSSGIDLWLKRVPYPIIDKWYAENLKSSGYYHIDHGEGHDPYHVGISRGTGGIGVWENDTLITSKNFIAYRTIATGPLRTIFELDYASWSSYNVIETKRISLDVGSNFSKFEIALKAHSTIPNYTIGITLHKNMGEVKLDKAKGVFRHYEGIDSSFVGEGIVIDPVVVTDAFTFETETPDQSQLLIVTQPKQEKLVYYAGFAWTKSKQIQTASDWDRMLERQSIIVATPLTVQVK